MDVVYSRFVKAALIRQREQNDEHAHPASPKKDATSIIGLKQANRSNAVSFSPSSEESDNCTSTRSRTRSHSPREVSKKQKADGQRPAALDAPVEDSPALPRRTPSGLALALMEDERSLMNEKFESERTSTSDNEDDDLAGLSSNTWNWAMP